jgi:hypothetical protein
MEWLRVIVPIVGVHVLSSGGDAVMGVVCVGGAGFHPKLWKICALCGGVGVWEWRAFGRNWGTMSGQ